MHKDRIMLRQLEDRIMSAEDAAQMIKRGMTIGSSGFTAVGYPKVIPKAIARLGEAHSLNVIAGASCGDEMDGELARAGLMAFRAPFNVNADARRQINEGTLRYVDMHLSHLPQAVRSGVFGKPDIAIIECCMITEKGGIVPTLSVGASNALIECSKKVILELNMAQPAELFGMHDIFNISRLPTKDLLNIVNVNDRIGDTAIFCDPGKIAAIVITDARDQEPRFLPGDETSSRIAGHVIDLLRQNMAQGCIPKNFTIQSGFGTVANAVLAELTSDEFGTLNMFTEVAQDSALELILEGKIRSASATALSLSTKGRKLLYDNLDSLHSRIVLRPQDISNNAGVIRTLGVIAMNTAIEVDIYGNVNSTHIMGSGMMNGLGGSGDFARNSAMSIFMTPSTAKNGKISSIVPMVPHVDHTEHDVQFIVTEQGFADLRGKCPNERASLIIERCAHPDYRPALREYYEAARRSANAMHTPHNLAAAFSWHQKFLAEGSML
ncbi:succinate CoA transferase [Desulfovibrio sp. OttesenSCG-928-O18]|nr:succinate CoA transferase [Desulfovibrio sp. OttesenSCG-928-O18]